MIRWLLRRWGTSRDDLDAAIATHLDALAERHRALGLTPEAARLAARRDFGSVLRVREDHRAQGGWRWFDELRQDLRYAIRCLRRTPRFGVVVVLTLAIGIGSTTAIFTVINGVLLEALPYARSEQQVRLRVSLPSRDGVPEVRALTLSGSEGEELRRRTRAFDYIGNITLSLANWPGHEPRWSGAVVTASVFPMLGVQPVLGRAFVAADEAEGAPGVMILSHGAWQSHFGGDRRVLGQSITLEPALTMGNAPTPKVYTVVGVMPAGFEYLPGSETPYWIPLQSPSRGFVVARLADGVSPETALAAVDPVLREIQGRRSGPQPLGYAIVGLHEQLVAGVRPALVALMGAVALLLLIACVNVANLCLGRSLDRQRETAIRAALGAGRGRLIRMLLTEGVILSLVAAMFGVAIAAGGVRLLRSVVMTVDRIDLGQAGGQLIPRLDGIVLDGGVVSFAIAVAAAAAVLFSLAPIVEQWRMNAGAMLKNGSGATPSGGFISRRIGMRGALIVVEVSLSVVLLVGGTLLAASFLKLMRVDNGYAPDRVLTFQVSLPFERYPLARHHAFAEAFTTRLRSVPGIASAAYANQLPLVQLVDTFPIGRTPDPQRPPGPGGDLRVVSTSYFDTMGIALKSGRSFNDSDAAGRQQVVVVNESLARREFGVAARAVGEQIYVGRNTTPWAIAGVVADVRQFSLDRAAEPQIFIDARQWVTGLSPLFPLGPYYAIRLNGREESVLGSVQTLVKASDAAAVLFNVTPMTAIVSRSVARSRTYMLLLAAFAVCGVAMALVGIFSVVSYTVSQRTRELGIRMAIGASRAVVLRLVIQQSLMLTLVGIVVGLLGAASLTGALETMLFELRPIDPPTYVAVALAFLGSAGLAALMPARRATRVDPIVALRTE